MWLLWDVFGVLTPACVCADLRMTATQLGALQTLLQQRVVELTGHGFTSPGHCHTTSQSFIRPCSGHAWAEDGGVTYRSIESSVWESQSRDRSCCRTHTPAAACPWTDPPDSSVPSLKPWQTPAQPMHTLSITIETPSFQIWINTSAFNAADRENMKKIRTFGQF